MKNSKENAANAASIENKNVTKVCFPELIEALRDVDLEECSHLLAAFIYYHYLENLSSFGVYFEDEAVSSLYWTRTDIYEYDSFIVLCDFEDTPIKSVLESQIESLDSYAIFYDCLALDVTGPGKLDSLTDFLESEGDDKKPLFGIFEKYLAEYWGMKSVRLTIDFDLIKVEVERN